MKQEHNHSKRHAFNGKNFIILPIIFCALIYLVAFFVLAPSVSSFVSIGSMFFSSGSKDFSEEYNNIFVPVEETPKGSNENSGNPNSIKLSEIDFPGYGDQFGELIIEDCQVDTKLFFGDNNVALNNGVGIYSGSAIPGYGKTILVAGHNNTYFNGLKYAKIGQQIKIRTSYGNFVYEITDIQIKDESDSTAYDLSADSENLILYTCYPFDELGLTSQRCFVYASPADSNPTIDKTN